MAKRRTGLQSEISSIFSGVPLPKKEQSESEPHSSMPKRPGPAPPRPPAPQRQVPDAPTQWQGIAQTKMAPSPKVREVTLSEKEIKSIPRAVSRRKKNKLHSSKPGAGSAKQKAETVLLVFFLIVLVVVLTRPFRSAISDSVASDLADPTKGGLSAKTDLEIDWPTPKVYRTDIRDPMILASARRFYVETLGPVVRGIVYSEDRPFAIIGIEMMREGEVDQGATIVKINPDSVVFEKDGKTWTQKVEGQER
jgi:hypothetical protein